MGISDIETIEELELFINETTLDELEYILACLGGPSNFLLRRRLGINEDFMKEINKAATLRQFEKAFLGDSN